MAGLKLYWFLIGALIVWRATHFFQAEDGPWDIVVTIRKKVGDGFWGALMDCFYCLSVWMAAPVAILIGETAFERLLLWPALSGAAILLERATQSKE